MCKALDYVKQDNWLKVITDLKSYYNKRCELSSIEKNILLWGHRVVIPEILGTRLLEPRYRYRSFIYWPKIDENRSDNKFMYSMSPE